MNKHNGNDLYIEIIAQAIEEMKEVQGESFSLENVNLAELERRTGITRARLRRMKANGFKSVPHGRSGQKADYAVLKKRTGISLLQAIRPMQIESIVLPVPVPPYIMMFLWSRRNCSDRRFSMVQSSGNSTSSVRN